MYLLLLSTYMAALSGLDTPERAAAIDSLAASKDVAGIVEAVYVANWRAREGLIEALARIGPEAVPALATLARRHPKADAQRLCVRGLGQAGGAAARDSALTLATGPHRDLAAEALGQIGDTTAIPVLRTLLSDASPDVRRRAAIALSAVAGKNAVDALVPLLSDAHHGVRFAVADALVALEAPLSVHGDALSQTGRFQALRILAKLGEEKALAEALNEQDWALRTLAADGLRDPAFRPALETALKRERHPVAKQHIRAALDRMP